LIGSVYKYKFKQQETFFVTGGAEQHFESDLIVWNASFSPNRETPGIGDDYLYLDEKDRAELSIPSPHALFVSRDRLMLFYIKKLP
jgi:hypothetical protein